MSLHNALEATKVRSEESELHIYEGKVSKDWCIGGIPHGGYVIGIILTAAGDLQSSSRHPDPVHLTAHYLQSVDVSECGVRLKIIRRGKSFTNINADLIRKGKTKIAARLIYGVLPQVILIGIACSDDLGPSKIPDCDIESGSWFELKDPNDVMEIAMIPLFADCITNEMNPGPMWFATVVLTIEFKSRIPTSISTPDTQFMTEGRHDEYAEVWTAPSIIGSCSLVGPTRGDKQVCLAISTQMALAIPWENSPRKGRL
ncbi:hypothetical protein ACEPAH_6413 [Sanghuangporus vaninii]